MADTILNHVEAALQAAEQDVVTYVQGHPQYQAIITQLGEQAIRELATAAGL